VEKLLADALDVPRKSVRIVSGKSSARKVIEIDGLEEAEVRRRLAKVIM